MNDRKAALIGNGFDYRAAGVSLPVTHVAQPESTRECPNCGNSHLIQTRTLNRKFCSDCNTSLYWGLQPGQTPLA